VKKKHGYELESFPAIRKRLGWRFHVGILCFIFAQSSATLFWLPGFYWSVLAVSVAIGVVVLRFWAFSRRRWFWMVMAPMIILQAPLVIAVNEAAKRYKGLFSFFVALADITVMNIAVRWVSPELRQDS
jgi:hypothetical protein